MVKLVDLTLKEIADTVENDIDKKVTIKLLNIFLKNDLTYKARTAYKSKFDLSPDSYRVFCYIKKSKEAMILNTKSYETGLFALQIRILNTSIFERLDEFSENIRTQILNGHDCSINGCGGCDKYILLIRGELTKNAIT